MTIASTDLNPGVLVQHPKFGLGKVVEVRPSNVLVHFRDDNQDVRRLSIDKSGLSVSQTESDPRLDSLPPFQDGKFGGRSKRIGLADAIDAFVRNFPGGFEDPAYIGSPIFRAEEPGERAFKWAAHESYEAALGNGLLEQLLAAGDLAEISQRILAVVKPTKMLSPFEATALRDGLVDEGPARRFFDAIVEFVAAPPTEPRFERLASALENLPAKPGKARLATWPVLTILPFLARPDQFMFLKPEPTVAGAHRLRFDLQYEASLRWITYYRLMTLSDFLLEQLRPRGARDYIDVQSFLWVIEKY